MISSMALKYARALLDVASETQSEDRVLAELGAFAQLLGSHTELRSTLENPVLPLPSKRAIVEALGPRIPISKQVQNFVLVTVANARVPQFESIVEAFSQVLDEKRGIQQGTVFSAQSLPETQRKRVTEGMERLTGGRVRLDFKEELDLIGGLKIHLGSTIFDGSIRARLNDLERRLAEQ